MDRFIILFFASILFIGCSSEIKERKKLGTPDSIKTEVSSEKTIKVVYFGENAYAFPLHENLYENRELYYVVQKPTGALDGNSRNYHRFLCENQAFNLNGEELDRTHCHYIIY